MEFWQPKVAYSMRFLEDASDGAHVIDVLVILLCKC